jgi:hypothetical protein
MTLYHGHDNAPFVFSGFPLWFYSRTQAMALGDWVLQSLWGLPRDPVWRGYNAPARAAPAAPAGISARPASARGPGR